MAKGNDGKAKESKAEGAGHAKASEKYEIDNKPVDAKLGELGKSVATHENAPTTLDRGVKQGKKEDDEYGIMSVITGKYVIDPGKPELDPKDMLKTQAKLQAEEAAADKKRSAAKVSKSKPQKKYT